MFFFFWVAAHKYKYFIYLLVLWKWPQFFKQDSGEQKTKEVSFFYVFLRERGKEGESENQSLFTKKTSNF